VAFPGDRRVLVTGLSGFTGAHLLPRLRADGWTVLGLGLGPAMEGVETLEADLEDRDAMAKWLREVRPNHILHLAALSHVVGDALPFYQTNVVGTENLLLAIADANIDPVKLVIASSANIYGNAGKAAIGEDTPPRPVNHYAVSKAAMELVARNYFDRWPTIIVRPFNYTGPGQSEAFVFAKLAAAFRRRDPRITLGNLEVARDLSHVRFVVDCYAKLLSSSVRSETVNICSGQCVTLREAIGMLETLSGHNPEIVSDPALQRVDEIAWLQGDPSKLRALLGSEAPPSPEDIFRDLLASG
jgi:GDP-6-deoxy-D-talose 4-dehydrogenase